MPASTPLDIVPSTHADAPVADPSREPRPRRRRNGLVPTSLPPFTFLRIATVEEAVGLCRSEIYARIAAGTFPKNIKLGTASRWRSDQVARWMNAQLGEQAS